MPTCRSSAACWRPRSAAAGYSRAPQCEHGRLDNAACTQTGSAGACLRLIVRGASANAQDRPAIHTPSRPGSADTPDPRRAPTSAPRLARRAIRGHSGSDRALEGLAQSVTRVGADRHIHALRNRSRQCMWAGSPGPRDSWEPIEHGVSVRSRYRPRVVEFPLQRPALRRSGFATPDLRRNPPLRLSQYADGGTRGWETAWAATIAPRLGFPRSIRCEASCLRSRRIRRSCSACSLQKRLPGIAGPKHLSPERQRIGKERY